MDVSLLDPLVLELKITLQKKLLKAYHDDTSSNKTIEKVLRKLADKSTSLTLNSLTPIIFNPTLAPSFWELTDLSKIFNCEFLIGNKPTPEEDIDIKSIINNLTMMELKEASHTDENTKLYHQKRKETLHIAIENLSNLI